MNRDSVQGTSAFSGNDARGEVRVLGCLVVESEEVQIERVVTRVVHRIPMMVSLVAANFPGQQPFGITIDLVSVSWEILNGSAIASLDLSIWVYLPQDGEIQAISQTHKIKALVGIPELTAFMRVEADFHVEDIEFAFDESDDEMVIEAVVSMRGLVLEKRIFHIVTGVSMEADTNRVAQEEGGPVKSGFLSVLDGFLKDIIRFIRREHSPAQHDISLK